MRDSRGFLGDDASNDRVVPVVENVILRAFGRYVFGILENKANVIISYYLVLVAFH